MINDSNKHNQSQGFGPNEINDFSNVPEPAVKTKQFIVNDKPYETNSLAESIIDLETGEMFPTLQPLLQHLAPDLYGSYTFNPDYPDNFYRLGDATRVRVIRRLQYLNNKPPVTPLVRELAPLVQWMAEHTQNSQTVSRSFWRAKYATDNDTNEAVALILYYGIFSSHNAHGKAIPGFNYHTIDEDEHNIIIQTHNSKLLPRFRNVQMVAAKELDRYSRTQEHKSEDTIKKLAFRAFYSGSENNGLWLTQTPEIHQYLQKLIQDIIKYPRKKLPDYEPPEASFNEQFTVIVPKQGLEKRNYYRPSGYESIPLEPDKVYKTKELVALGISQPNVSKGTKKGYFLNVGHGQYMLNPDFKGGN